MQNESALADPDLRPPRASLGYGRVAVLGPLPPFRGGIALHTTLLRRALRRRADLHTVSFSRQYPAWLFPGESDREAGARRLEDADCSYLIDSLNPLTWKAAFDRIQRHTPKLVLVVWWTVYWAPCFWYLARRCRRAGYEIRFLCHNVFDHEATWWKTALTKAVLKQGHSYVVQSHQEQRNLAALLPGARVLVHPHPIFDHLPEYKGRPTRRADLELLFYGFVRPYKGLDVLIEALGHLRNKRTRLTVAGEFWTGLEEIMGQIRRLGLEKQVELIPRYVTEEETAEYFARADAVVLPYRSATGSGVLSIAYHYGKPAIATTVGGFSELVRHNETGLLVPPESPEALARAIDGLTRERAAAMAPAIRKASRTMTWDSLADTVLEI